MRIIFMGSAPLACKSMKALLSSPEVDIAAVITQPDRPRGRNLQMGSCSAKLLAEENGVPVFTPENVNSQESLDVISSYEPELAVIVAYGQILKPDLLSIPPGGFVNIHASLLPKYRGAAPIQCAVANGDTVSGVTTMFINERMDAGDILMQTEVPILPEDTAGILHDKLANAGADLLLETLQGIKTGSVTRIPQDDGMATIAHKLTKADGRIDWTLSATEIYNRVRGFNPWPVCWTELRYGDESTLKKLRVLTTTIEDRDGEPGTVIDVKGAGPVVGARENSVRLLEVQPEGRKVMSGASYLSGYDLKVGDLFV